MERCKTTATGDPKVCNCSPSYYGSVWDRVVGRYRKTPRFRRLLDARDAKEDLHVAIRNDTVTDHSKLSLEEARARFVAAASEGVALNKWGRTYRRRAVGDLESSLAQMPDWLAGRKLTEIRRGDVQRLTDELSGKGLSGSRVRSIINALRSLYRWADDHEMASNDPAARIRLPAMQAKPRDKVVTPGEFNRLMDALSLETPGEKAEEVKRDPTEALRETIPYALAAYASARNQEIRVLDWSHVRFDLGAVELAADEEGRKPGGSWRVVPAVKPLLTLLKRAWIAQGRPKKGKVCPPRKQSRSGLIAVDHLQGRVRKRWTDLGLEPITLHEARHSTATWLDHAGVSPKVASELMGHRTPSYQPGAAAITLRRYTHTLPGELERARDQLDRFLAERGREESRRLDDTEGWQAT